MHTLRSAKATYVAAFLLGALIALLLNLPSRAADLADTTPTTTQTAPL
jgi:hypothetical protein